MPIDALRQLAATHAYRAVKEKAVTNAHLRG
jgi:hypothetical protein